MAGLTESSGGLLRRDNVQSVRGAKGAALFLGCMALWAAFDVTAAPAAVPGEAGATIELRTNRWLVGGMEGRRTVVLVLPTETCGSPEIDHVSVRQGPRAQGARSLILTAYERFTEFKAPPQPTGSNVVHDCFGIGLRLTARVKLPLPTSEVLLFDGSTDPPQRRPVCARLPRKPSEAAPGPVGIADAVPICQPPAGPASIKSSAGSV